MKHGVTVTNLLLTVVGLCACLGTVGCGGAARGEAPTTPNGSPPDKVREALRDSAHMAMSTNNMKMLLLATKAGLRPLCSCPA